GEHRVAHVLARAERDVDHVGIRIGVVRRGLDLEVTPRLGAHERTVDVHLVRLVDAHTRPLGLERPEERTTARARSLSHARLLSFDDALLLRHHSTSTYAESP